MKNINIYKHEKYNSANYIKVEEDIYLTKYQSKRVTMYKGISKSEYKSLSKKVNLKEIEISEKFVIDNINYMKCKKIGKIKLFEKNYYIGKEITEPEEIYVISLSFEQDFEHGENRTSKNISQHPIEDLLDKYSIFISDFYDELNSKDTNICYYEFASKNINNIKRFREIIGKRIYLKDGNLVIKNQ